MNTIRALFAILCGMIRTSSNLVVHASDQSDAQQTKAKNHIKKIAFAGGTTISIATACVVAYIINKKNTNLSLPPQSEKELKDDTIIVDSIKNDGHVEYFTQEPIDDDTEIDTIEDDGDVEYFTEEVTNKDDEKESQKYDRASKKVKNRLKEEELIEKEESEEKEQDKEQAEILMNALKGGESLDRIKELLGDFLDAELDVNMLQENTALHYASEGGNKEVVSFFIEELVQNRRMDIDKKDSNGRTALHYAAWKGHLDAVKCLVEAGSKIDEPQEQPDLYVGLIIRTALHYAAYSGEPAILNYLIEHGAETNIVNSIFQENPLRIVKQKFEEAFDETERTKLQSMINTLQPLMIDQGRERASDPFYYT